MTTPECLRSKIFVLLPNEVGDLESLGRGLSNLNTQVEEEDSCRERLRLKKEISVLSTYLYVG